MLAFTAAPASGQQSTVATINAHLDSVVPSAISKSHVPGAVIAIVRNDSTIALRGFGFVHLEDSVRADGERSIYRLASVAKLFVAAVVLDRVADGVLDLDRNVQDYLPDVRIPATFAAPVTLRHLLTHTAGFDERMIGYAAPSRAAMRPLGTYLSERLPDRGWPPAQLVSYSNHGMALAAYTAEAESRESFDNLAVRRLFNPLGMSRTYYIGPADSSLAQDLAPGYRCGPGGCERAPPVWSHAYPVGLAYSTAADMSRFMRAWLNGGVLDGRRVLDSSTVAAALKQQFTHDPRLPGIGFAFFEQFRGGERMLGHVGGVPGTATSLMLIPSQRVGIFIATNAGEPGFTRQVMESLLDLLLPQEPSPAQVATGPVEEYAGSWKLARYSHSTIERLPGAFAFTTRAYARGDTLMLPSGASIRRFVRVDSLMLQEVEGSAIVVLKRNADGRLSHMFTGIPTGGAEFPGAYERDAWYEGAGFLNEYVSWLAGLVPMVLLIWGVVSSVGRVRRRLARSPAAPSGITGQASRLSAIAVMIALVSAALFMWFVFGFVAAGSRDLGRGQGIAQGMTPMSLVLLRLAWPLAMAAIPVAIFAVMSWRRKWWNVFGRVCYSVIALWSIAITHFMIWWKYIPGRW